MTGVQTCALPIYVLVERLVGVVVGVSKALGQVVAVEDETLAALVHHETVERCFGYVVQMVLF